MKDEEIKKLTQEIQNKINSIKMCWICGRDDYLTSHHVIPVRMKNPKMNVSIPLCSNCQEILHVNDLIVSLLLKMFRSGKK